MSLLGIFDISGSAMNAESLRLNVTASNLANANSTRTEEGGPYRRQDVVFSSTSVPSNPVELKGVKVADVVADGKPPKRIYDPAHPDADKDGFVAMPNINAMEEMVNMMMALRAYEASVATFNTAKTMMLKTLELGRV